MPPTADGPDSRRRLAEVMEDWRLSLDLTWEEVARRAGMAGMTLRRIRKNESALTRRAKRKIERGLEWAEGDVDVVLEGGQPTPRRHLRTTTDADVPEDLRLPEGLELRDEVETAIWAIVALSKDVRQGYIHLRRAGEWPPPVSGLSQSS